MKLRNVAMALAFCLSLSLISYAQDKSREERLKAVAKELRDASNPQVKAILTPGQYQQLQQIRQKRRAELMQEAKSQTNR
jgi:hypothetical protein